MAIEALKRKVRLHYFHNLESTDNSVLSEGEEITELSGNLNRNLTVQKFIIKT